jgi:glycosyltransferase involved in cell wall biosynthesis
MKVLHVGTKTWPPSHGGVEKLVYDLAQGGGKVESWVLADDCTAPSERVGRLAPGLLASWRQVRALARRESIDLVHLHKETSIPLALLLRGAGLRCVLTLHGLAWRLARWSWPSRTALWGLDLVASLALQAVVFVGERDHRAYSRWLPTRRLVFIPNGVDVPPDSPLSGGGKGWVYLGRISPEKNVNALVEAALRAGMSLDLYGPLDERDKEFSARFRVLCAQDGIRWHGPLPYDQVPSTLAQYQVLANPSFSEGLPLSVLEAAAQGLFLVLSDIPQHRLLGFPEAHYVSPRNIVLDPMAIRAPCGTANQHHARVHFSLVSMVERYHQVYHRVAARPEP